MSLVRLPDWVARLNAWVAANRTRPFAWGEWANEYKIAPEAKTGVKICQNQQTE
jgi:hypothetical protein